MMEYDYVHGRCTSRRINWREKMIPYPGIVSGVNDPKPKEKPEKGMQWIRMKGGPLDGQWIQKPKN